MNNQEFISIANWKTYFTFNQALTWINTYGKDLEKLAESNHIILCPSLESIASIKTLVKDSKIMLAGQDCSAYDPGAHTGQILAASLKEIGCSHVIIGHSEQRIYCQESPQVLQSKLRQALAHSLIPIIYIGETAQEYQQNRAAQSLRNQIEQIAVLALKEFDNAPYLITYEPLWVSSAQSLDMDYIQEHIKAIKELCTQLLPGASGKILYGGQVSQKNIQEFKKMESLDGVALGLASTDFQKLEKIVLL